MTTINLLPLGIGTFSPTVELIPPEKVVVKRRSRKLAKGAGAMLSYADLRRLAKSNKPPQTWYDEFNG